MDRTSLMNGFLDVFSRKRTLTAGTAGKSLIYFQIIYNCIVRFFVIDLHLPSFLYYGTDIITLLLLVFVLMENRCSMRFLTKTPLVFALLLLLEGTVSSFLHYNSFLLYLWSLRNVFRFFLFFYCCAMILTKDDIPAIFNLLEKLFLLNGVVCVIGYFAFDVKHDFMGGLFGNGIIGGNGPLNVLMIVVFSYVALEYLNNNKPILELLLVSVLCSFIAAVAELKFFFIELILISMYFTVFVKKNYRLMIYLLIAALICVFAGGGLTKLYPKNEDFLSMDFVVRYSYETGYSTSSDFNRLSAIDYISKNCFDNDLGLKLFGVGLGNGERSKFSFLISPFYKEYGSMVKYHWFSHSFMFVECGLVGLGLYLMFFVSIFLRAFRNRKQDKWMMHASVIALLAMMIVFYNQTLRIEAAGYMMFLLLSIPYLQGISVTERRKNPVLQSAHR